MIALKQILVPTDFSEPSQVAVRYGVALAEAFQAQLHIVHVLETPFNQVLVSEVYVPPPPNMFAEWEKNAQDALERVLAPADRQKCRAELVLRHGNPYLEIIDYAKSKDIDLIVMGTHGRGGMAHLLMGSTAERVVRKSPCPVLTVRHPEHEFVTP